MYSRSERTDNGVCSRLGRRVRAHVQPTEEGGADIVHSDVTVLTVMTMMNLDNASELSVTQDHIH